MKPRRKGGGALLLLLGAGALGGLAWWLGSDDSSTTDEGASAGNAGVVPPVTVEDVKEAGSYAAQVATGYAEGVMQPFVDGWDVLQGIVGGGQ